MTDFTQKWNNIEDYRDLPCYDGVYEFKDKEGNIEEIFVDINDNNSYSNLDKVTLVKEFIAWRNVER